MNVLKIVLAIINTVVSSLIIFLVLFSFGFVGFEYFKYHGLSDNIQMALWLLLIPILIFGIIFGWTKSIKQGHITKRNGVIIGLISIIIGVIALLIAGQVGIFVYL